MAKRIMVLALYFVLFTSLGVFGAKKQAAEKMVPTQELKQDMLYSPAENVISRYLLTPAPKLLSPLTTALVGSTGWDFWHNDCQRRQTAYDELGDLHFVWRYRVWDDTLEAWGTPYLYYNARLADASWLAEGTGSDVSGGLYGAYAGIDVLPDSREVIAAHHYPGAVSLNWCAYLDIEKTTPGLGEYNHYDIPDSIPGWKNGGLWPYLAIAKGPDDDTVFMHVTVQQPDSGGAGYVRCFIDPVDDTLLRCQAPGQSLMTVAPNKKLTPNKAIYEFAPLRDNMTGAPVATAPDSHHVAVAWIQQLGRGTPNWYKGEVKYLESSNNGADWMTAGNMGTPIQITNYGAGGWAYTTPQTDITTVYDYNNNLHIFWVTGVYPTTTWNPITLWHWDRNSGRTSMVDQTSLDYATFTDWNKPINKMTAAVAPDAPNYLWVSYSKQLDSDTSALGISNGHLIVKASSNGGQTWGPEVAITTTNSPGCTPGNCFSNQFPSMAERADTAIYVFYLEDKDAGPFVQTTETNNMGVYTLNPVRYISYPRPTVPAVANIMFAPTQFTSPIEWATNHSSKTDSIKFDNTGTTTLQVQLSGPSWLTPAPSSFSIAELGATQKVTFTFNGGPYADTFFTDSLRIVSNSGAIGGGAVWKDTQYVHIRFVVTDTFYYAEFDTCKIGPVLVVSNVGNMGGQSDSAGMFYKGLNYLFDASGVMATNQVPGVGSDNVGFSWIHSKADFLPEAHLDTLRYNKLKAKVWIDKLALLNWRRPDTDPGHWAWFGWTKWSKIIQFDWVPGKMHGVLIRNWWTPNLPPKWWMDVASTAPVGGYFGIAGDWDVTASFSGKDKGGIIDSLNLVYLRQDTVNADKYYGGYQMLSAYVKKGANTTNYTTPFAMHAGRNYTQMYPFSGYDDDSLWKYMSMPGDFIEQDSAQDMNVFISAVEMLNPDATTEIFAEYSALVSDSGLTDFVRQAAMFKRIKPGDANFDGKVTVSDVVYLVNYLFKAGPEPWLMYSDANGDAQVTVSDVVYLVNYLFKSGPLPKFIVGDKPF